MNRNENIANSPAEAMKHKAIYGEGNYESYTSAAFFPATGDSEKLYIAEDTEFLYRWDGLNYINLSTSELSESNIIYVGKHGNDSNTGLNMESAKLTFAAAITAASALTPVADNVVSITCLDIAA